MSPSPASLALARDLLALEQTRGKATGRARNASGEAGGHADPAAQVCAKLRATLTTFAGTNGFRSLLTRALTLAKAQEPALDGVQVLEDGSLSGLDQLGGASREATGAGRVLVAQLLDLLIILIGEPLTLQLVRSAWPAVSASASRSRNKGTA